MANDHRGLIPVTEPAANGVISASGAAFRAVSTAVLSNAIILDTL